MHNSLKNGKNNRIEGMISGLLFVMTFLCLLCGCGVEKTDEKKVKDLNYSLVKEEDIPEELLVRIEEKKAAAFKIVYENDKDLYVVCGYGEQETGGYSIQIKDFYLTRNAIVFSSNLLGPAKDAIRNPAPSYPYIVLKTENQDKHVIFN